MHDKKNYINKSTYSIQGIKTVGKSLPRELKTILKKGGHNYSSMINNWTSLVGKKISDVTYPKSIKTSKELRNGILILNVDHGDQLFIEYSKKDIIDKINTFFGYQFIKEVRLVLIKRKTDKKEEHKIDKDKSIKYGKKIKEIQDSNLKRNLSNLIDVFSAKK